MKTTGRTPVLLETAASWGNQDSLTYLYDEHYDKNADYWEKKNADYWETYNKGTQPISGVQEGHAYDASEHPLWLSGGGGAGGE